MGITDPDTSQCAIDGLGDRDDIVHYDNSPVNGVQLRHTGSSYVQTIPDGAGCILDLEEGEAPSILIHTEANAITFLYNDDENDAE